MKSPSLLFLALLTVIAAAHAGPRTSTSYAISADTTDAGGKRTTSANYTHDGSAGGCTGLSTVAAPAETAKAGYIGQLYDVTGLTLTAISLNVNEGATDQLSALQALDDATFLAMPATSVAWSVASGPLTGINANGLATAGIVYQSTAAVAQGVFGGFTATLSLTVRNVNSDDFGIYAGDGIDDAWQVQYFGLNNPNAAPNVDFDGTGQSNLFKYLAGLNPLDPASRFVLTIAPITVPTSQRNLLFTPLTAGRTYTVQFKNTLTDPAWQTLTGSTQSDNGATRTVTDTTANPSRFYRVQVSKP